MHSEKSDIQIHLTSQKQVNHLDVHMFCTSNTCKTIDAYLRKPGKNIRDCSFQRYIFIGFLTFL